MLIFGLETDHLAERLEEFVGRVDDEIEVELLYDISLLFSDLSCSVLVGTASDQLLHLGDLISLLELGRHVESSHSHQLQLTQRHFLHRQILVNQ